MLRIVLALFLFLFLLLGCSDDPDPADAGRDGGLADAGMDGSRDAGTAFDAGGDSGIDAGQDAGTDAGGDAGAMMDAADDALTDAGSGDARIDSGDIPAGECNLGSPLCDVMCLRAVFCVTECGGPRTGCGCCPCAAGSIDDIMCPPGS